MNARKLLSAAKAVEAAYIEDVFSTYLYTGNGSTQTITNGIDLSGKGGLVWIKMRSVAGYEHVLTDTARGAQLFLSSDNTLAQQTGTNDLTAFTSTGFSLGSSSRVNRSVVSENQFASWTFRKQAKFFDVVTYTGNGVAGRTVAHNLGSVPGCMIIKQYSASGQDWPVYHRSLGATYVTWLNLTNASSTSRGGFAWNNTAPTSTVFTVGDGGETNSNGTTYVAYLFAHDAGGFGASGSDNVITCGSFTTDGSGNATVTLGYEPQWLLRKDATNAGTDWHLYDSMRGLTVAGQADAILYPNSSAAENSGSQIGLTATGFTIAGFAVSSTYIYIAIRRGPMKTPTTGTSVYTGVTRSGTGTSATISAGFVVDWWHCFNRGAGSPQSVSDRLRGSIKRFETNSTAAEDSTGTDVIFSSSQLGIVTSTLTGVNYNASGNTYIDHLFARAPGFFDVVCYTGTGSGQTISHNLGVAPELLIVKRRSTSGTSWATWATSLTADQSLALNTTDDKNAVFSVGFWNSTLPTSSVFSVGSNVNTNSIGETYAAYLFATCPGVSKVGSYTGTGSTLQIDCGFTGGARFVLIKRTDSTGDWYVWDSARGIVAGNDPYLLLNSTAAEVTTTDWVDTHSPGFELSSAVGNNANINTASYIFLAIA